MVSLKRSLQSFSNLMREFHAEWCTHASIQIAPLSRLALNKQACYHLSCFFLLQTGFGGPPSGKQRMEFSGPFSHCWDFDFADDLALISHSHQQMRQNKTPGLPAAATQLGKWIVTILIPPTSGFNPKLSLSESPLTLLRNSSKRNGKRLQEEM